MTREKLVGWANRYAGVACEVGEAMEVAEAVLSLVQGEARLQVERDDAMAVSSERSKRHTAAVARAEAAEAEVSLAVGALTGMQDRVKAAEAKLAGHETRLTAARKIKGATGSTIPHTCVGVAGCYGCGEYAANTSAKLAEVERERDEGRAIIAAGVYPTALAASREQVRRVVEARRAWIACDRKGELEAWEALDAALDALAREGT